MDIKLTQQELRYISVVEPMTGTPINDCIERDNRVTFIVGKGNLGKAVGKQARNIKKLENLLKKEVRFVEYDDDVKQFIVNLFKPFKLEKVMVDDDTNRISVIVDAHDKGKAIGKGGKNITILREIAQRHHGIDELKVL
jgi:N utilization substance protein A